MLGLFSHEGCDQKGGGRWANGNRDGGLSHGVIWPTSGRSVGAEGGLGNMQGGLCSRVCLTNYGGTWPTARFSTFRVYQRVSGV